MREKISVPNRLQRLHGRERSVLIWAAWLILLLGWEAAVRVGAIPALYLPAPTTVLAELQRLLLDGTLPAALLASGIRWLVGVAGGTLCALVPALALGLSPTGRKFLLSGVHVFYPMPKIALLPLLVLWLGIGELPKYVIIGLGVFFPLALNTLAALAQVPRQYYEVAAVYPTSRGRLIREVLWPAILPAIFTGLRLGCGTALILLIAAEMLAADTGLGALILQYGGLMLTAPLLACVAVLSLAGVLIQWLLTRAEYYAMPWRRKEKNA